MAITAPVAGNTDDYAYYTGVLDYVQFYITTTSGANFVANPEVGDFIVVYVVKDDDAGGGITPPTGKSWITAPTAGAGTYDEWFDIGFTAGDDLRIAGYFTEVTSAVDGSQQQLFTLGESEECLLVAFVVKGADASDFTDSVTPASGTTQNVDGDPNADPPGLTTNTDGAMVITIVANRSDADAHLGVFGDYSIPPSGFTMTSDGTPVTNVQGAPHRLEQGIGNGDVGLSWAYAIDNLAGAVNPGVWTNFAGGRDMHMVTMAIKPSFDLSGSASISHGHTVTATGEQTDRSGSASISVSHAVEAEGANYGDGPYPLAPIFGDHKDGGTYFAPYVDVKAGTSRMAFVLVAYGEDDAVSRYITSMDLDGEAAFAQLVEDGGANEAIEHAVGASFQENVEIWSFPESELDKIGTGAIELTVNFNGTCDDIDLFFLQLENCDQSAAVNVVAGQSLPLNSSNPPALAVTTTDDSVLIIDILAGTGESGQVNASTATSGQLELAEQVHSFQTGAVSRHIRPSSGATSMDWAWDGVSKATAQTAIGIGPPTGEDYSGSGTITETHSVTATGVKAGKGTGTITNTGTVAGVSVKAAAGTASIVVTATPTAAGASGRSSIAAISHGHSVTATGDAIETRFGTAEIISTHVVSATGDKASGEDASISHGHSVTATGDKNGQDTASIVTTHDVTATGTSGREDSGSVSHGHTVTATGVKDDTDNREGSGSIIETHSVVATGVKNAADTGSIVETHSVVATGDKAAADAASIPVTAPITATGSSARSADASISHGHTVTATGIKSEGSDDRFGSGTIIETHSVTATGVKGARGVATIDVDAHIVKTFTNTIDVSDEDGSCDGGDVYASSTDTTSVYGYDAGGNNNYSWLRFDLPGVKPDDVIVSAKIRLVAAETRNSQLNIIYEVYVEQGEDTTAIDVSTPAAAYSDLAGRSYYAISTERFYLPEALTSGDILFSDDFTETLQRRIDDDWAVGAFAGPLFLCMQWYDSDWQYRHVFANLEHATLDPAQIIVTVEGGEGTKAAESTASIDTTATVTASGVKGAARSASIDTTATATAAGTKAAADTASISHGHTITATGHKTEADNRFGSGSIAATGSVVAAGRKDASGTASIDPTAGSVATGVKAAADTASISHPATVTATGFSSEDTEHYSGSGTIVETHSIIATGAKGAEGAAEISVHTNMWAVAVVFIGSGDAEIQTTATVVATGQKDAEGSAVINVGTDDYDLVTAIGTKSVAGDASLPVTAEVTATYAMWFTTPRGKGRGLTDDGQAPGRIRRTETPGVTDDGAPPGWTNSLQSPGRTT